MTEKKSVFPKSLAYMLIVAAVALSTTGYALENKEDLYIESVLFGDLPDVFSAIKTTQNILRAPSSITVFKENDIRLSGARTLSDLLKYVPGMYVTPSRTGFDLLKVRGEQDRYNYRILLIVDGIPRRELFYGYTSINELVPLENVKQIEVIRGPGSALYGTNAYAGVVSVFTKSAGEMNLMIVDAGYGEFDTRKFNIAAAQKTASGLDFSLNVRLMSTQGYKIDRGRDGYHSSESNDNSGHNFDVKVRYKDFTFLGSYSFQESSYPWSRYDRSKDEEEKNTVFGVKYETKITDQTELSGIAYYNRFDMLETQIKSDEYSESIHENSIFGTDIHLNHEFSSSNQMIAGLAIEDEVTGENIEQQREGSDPFELTQWIQDGGGNRGFSRMNYALYLQDIWQITDSFEGTFGIRYDDYEQYGDSFSPRVGLLYNPIEKLTFKMLYGQAFRGPTYKELFIKELDGGQVVASGRANSELDAEQIETFEFETGYIFNKSFMTKIRYFYNDYDDTIMSVDNSTEYQNYDGLYTEGLELEADYRINKFSGYTNLTFTRGDEQALYGYPYYQVNSILKYSPLENLDTQIGVRYISDRRKPLDYHSGIPAGNPEFATLTAQDNLEDYFDVELSLIYIISDHWKVSGTMYNLFDDTNYNPSYEPGEYWDIIHEGRAYFINLTYMLPE